MLKTLASRLILSYVAVVLLALLLASLALLVLGIQYKRDEAYARLSSSIYFMLPQARFRAGQNAEQTAAARAIREAILPQLEATDFRLLVLSPAGAVLADSKTTSSDTIKSLNLAQATPLDDRPLLKGSTTDAAGKNWLYVAAPPRELLQPGSAANATARAALYVVLAQRTPSFAEVWDDLRRQLWLAAALGLIAALLLGTLLARSITRPLSHLSRATRQMAAGNYNQHVPLEGSTEFVALAEHFNAMAAEVERTRRVQHDFLANVSHDLKTPLTSIQGFSQAMLDGTIRDPAGFAGAAGVINDEAVRMSRLVADLLDLTRIRSGEAQIEKTMLDLRPLLEQATAVMQPQATTLHVRLTLEVAPLPPILADPDRLRRALTNLIDNALRHTPPEGRVIVRGEVAPGAVAISVRDSGEGIPPADLPRIFERFYQIDKSRASKGGSSGLGLAIVQEIVAAHGGQLGVQSQLGVGTEFRITLPTSAAPLIEPPQVHHGGTETRRTKTL